MIEGGAQLGGALFDLLFEPLCRAGAFDQQRVALDCVLAQHLDRAPHRGNLIGAPLIDDDVTPACGNRSHPGADAAEAPEDIAPDIQPDDQH